MCGRNLFANLCYLTAHAKYTSRCADLFIIPQVYMTRLMVIDSTSAVAMMLNVYMDDGFLAGTTSII